MEENTASPAPNEIRFYSWTNPECRFMSNFYSAPFDLDGKIWPSVEHYYQAMKSPNPSMQDYIRACGKPGEAKRLGGMLTTAEFSLHKDGVMRKALYAKFTQNPALALKLLATGDAKIIEASPTDYYWGEGETKAGKNKLGVMLMELRAQLDLLAGRRQDDPDAWLDYFI